MYGTPPPESTPSSLAAGAILECVVKLFTASFGFCPFCLVRLSSESVWYCSYCCLCVCVHVHA